MSFTLVQVFPFFRLVGVIIELACSIPLLAIQSDFDLSEPSVQEQLEVICVRLPLHLLSNEYRLKLCS